MSPLQDRFDQRLRDIPASALHSIVFRVARIEAFRGWWDGTKKPAGAIRRRIFAATAAKSAAASARVASPPPPAEEEAGYARTLLWVFEGYEGMPPAEDRILALHAGIFRTSPSGRLHAGKYKTMTAAGSTFQRWDMEPVALRAPGPLLVPAQMETLTAWFASRIGGEEFHPLLVSAAYLLEFLSIRPFAEGNGRMGRMLANLLLLRCGHGYVPYASLDAAATSDWTEYYLALRKGQASRNLPHPDISPWLIAFLDALILQQAAVRKALDRLVDGERLTPNQAAVLAIAARDGEVTNRKAAEEVGMPRDTAKQTLNRLAALGALRRLGAGRATRYRLPDG